MQGKESCYYHLTETETNRKVYELLEGVYIDLEFNPGEEIYLVYYHSHPESFRVLSMLSYGEIAFQAKQFTELEFSSINELLDKVDKDYSFGGFASDASLKILRSDKSFCSNCYYLIAARS